MRKQTLKDMVSDLVKYAATWTEGADPEKVAVRLFDVARYSPEKALAYDLVLDLLEDNVTEKAHWMWECEERRLFALAVLGHFRKRVEEHRETERSLRWKGEAKEREEKEAAEKAAAAEAAKEDLPF